MTTARYSKTRALAQTFPTFAPGGSKALAPGLDVFDAESFDLWLATSGCSHGERVTGQFILAVFNPGVAWVSGRFDLMEALGVWDEAHRAAFCAWAANPWWE